MCRLLRRVCCVCSLTLLGALGSCSTPESPGQPAQGLALAGGQAEPRTGAPTERWVAGEVEGSFQAPWAGMLVRADAQGVHLMRHEGAGDKDGAKEEGLSLSLARWGQAGALLAANASAPLARDKGISYARGPGLQEWWTLHDGVLEQGWTLERPLPGQDTLVLELVLDGAQARGAGDALVLAQRGGGLHYRGLKAVDARGRVLASRMEGKGPTIRIETDLRRAEYPVVVDPAFVPAGNPRLQLTGSLSQFGDSVAFAGDMNADGFDDVVVGAPSYPNPNFYDGLIAVYLGASTGLPVVPDFVYESDVPSAQLGKSVASAGDINGDGFDDILVGAPRYSNGEPNEGSILLFLGGAVPLLSAPDWQFETNLDSAALGSLVAGVGDTNLDGYDDLLGASETYTNPQYYEGAAYLFFGSAAGPAASPDWFYESDLAPAQFGTAAVGTDINGDSYSDVLVGAPEYANGELKEGAVYVFQGSASGPSPNPDLIIESNLVRAYIGGSLAAVGDTNGDGLGDLLVGAPYSEVFIYGAGAAYLYPGTPSGLAMVPSWANYGGNVHDLLGFSVSGAGDVNGDGYTDVLVATPNITTSTGQGRVQLFEGNTGSLSSTPTWISRSGTGQFARSIASDGDFNGDGARDLLIGDGNYTGRVYVYRGGSNPDYDGDGFDHVDWGGADCNDDNPSIYPGAPERCNGVDDDCNGSLPVDEWDGDSDGLMGCQGDCDDTNPLVGPGQVEICDGQDNDCDGTLPPDEVDADGDGFLLCDGDCDDTNSDIFPGSIELCDGLDNNCDGDIDVGVVYTDYYPDADGDGYGEENAAALTTCDGTQPVGMVSNNLDCDDADPGIHPYQSEYCNGRDDNCDGNLAPDEMDLDGDGFSPCQGDCDDNTPDAFPGNPEVCDGLDNDCDGAVDDGLPFVDYYVDSDGDGYGGNLVDAFSTCGDGPPGMVDNNSDCDDLSSAIHPGASERCDDALDNDCDEQIDINDADCEVGGVGGSPEGCDCSQPGTGPTPRLPALALLMLLLLWTRGRRSSLT